MSKEHSYAYEAGYRDGAINYELDHCPACKNVADLQEALDENAKLRELVRVMAYCNQYSPDCNGCRMNGAAGIITERAGCDELLARLRELGVEVE